MAGEAQAPEFLRFRVERSELAAARSVSDPAAHMTLCADIVGESLILAGGQRLDRLRGVLLVYCEDGDGTSIAVQRHLRPAAGATARRFGTRDYTVRIAVSAGDMAQLIGAMQTGTRPAAVELGFQEGDWPDEVTDATLDWDDARFPRLTGTSWLIRFATAGDGATRAFGWLPAQPERDGGDAALPHAPI